MYVYEDTNKQTVNALSYFYRILVGSGEKERKKREKIGNAISSFATIERKAKSYISLCWQKLKWQK